MKQEQKKQQDKAQQAGRFERSTQPDSSSRYSNPETFRTGSRYQDKMATPKGVMQLTSVLAVLAAIIAAAYIIVAVIFSKHFYPGTTIYGINCAAKTAQWTREEVSERIGTYVLTVQERENRSDVITADQVGLQYSDKGDIEQWLASQKSFIWPVMMMLRRGKTIPIETVYDVGKIDEAIRSMGCMQEESQIPPQDAHVGETDEGYTVVPEVMGTRLDYDRTRAAVMFALDQEAASVSLEEHDCYVNPTVYQDDEELHREVEERNKLLGADITFDFSDRTERVNTPVIMDFIVEDSEGGYKIDPDSVWGYVYELAHKYDTYGGTRTFHTTIGTEETLYGGDYGWAMDQDATAQMLLDDIREKKTETIEPIYAYTAKSRNVNDIGSTYVEICIKRQEMWCYQDGYLVVDTPVVTGNVSKGTDTPSGGVWAIDGKQTKAVLVGEGYRQPVDYWIPFNGGVGIHDLQSRWYFGGDIYLTHGSHGCVNTPLDAVKQIYDVVSTGTPVIVYEGE